MKKLKILCLTLIVIICVIFFIVKSKEVKYNYINEVTLDYVIDTPYWRIIYSEDDEELKKYKINFDNIDFEKGNIIISYGGKINKIKYFNNYYCPIFNDTSIKVYMLQSDNKICFYEIKDKDIRKDFHILDEYNTIIKQ